MTKPSDETDQASELIRPPNCASAGIEVVRDIYYMKTMAVEVVAQLAVDHMRHTPNCTSTAGMLTSQLQEEFQHLTVCQDFLCKRGALGKRPSYVSLYAQLMRSVARRRRRFFPLALATVLCVAVEIAALKQLSEAAQYGGFQALYRHLYQDEQDHFELVARVVAPRAAAQASWLERLYGQLTALGIVLVTAFSWWPTQLKFYETSGLDLDRFGREVINSLSGPLEELKVFLSPLLLRRSVEFALRRKITVDT
jgi:hypothetical protein